MTRRLRAQGVHGIVAFVVIPLLVFAAIWTLRTYGKLFALEALAYDNMIARNAGADPDASPIVILGIDETDIREHLKQYPISDRQMLTLLQRLIDAGARSIAIDIYRDLPNAIRGTANFEIDHGALVDFILKHPEIIIVQRIAESPDDMDFVNPPLRLSENDANQQVAASSVAADHDSVVRRVLPFWHNYHPPESDGLSLGAMLALKHLAADKIELRPTDDSATLLLGHATIRSPRLPAGFYTASDPTPEEAAGEVFEWMADFRSPRDLRTYHYRDLVSGDDATANKAMRDKLKDKSVLIGVTAKSIKDFVSTPLSRETGGFVMHGYVADQMIRWAKSGQEPPVFSTRRIDLIWTIGWALLGGMTGGVGVARSLWKMFVFVGIELLLLTALTFMVLQLGIILPFVPPLLVLMASILLSLAYMSAVERQDRQMVQQLINMHISPQIAEQLLENRDAFFEAGKLTPQRMTATVLFSDLMNFTPIAENMDSTALMNWLNDFFEQMTRCVEECGGVVNKFNGDMVMALFGPPQVHEKPDEIARDARNAVRCAVLMRRALAAMNIKWKAQGLPTPLMRIGVYTGPLVAGSLGGKNRVEYTVIGDTVNTASRLESSNKECMDDALDGTRIIIGDTTCAALGQHYHVKPLGEWELKGRDAVAVHAVLHEQEGA